MKPFILFLKILMMVFATNCISQTLIKCKDRLAYWVIPDNQFHYSVKLTGDIDLSNHPEILNIDEKALQYVLLNKDTYIKKDENNDESTILLRYVAGETLYLRNKFNNQHLDTHNDIIKFDSGKIAIIWYFKMPEGKNKEVIAQLFADIVIDGRIFGLGTPLFAGQDFDALATFLLETIETIEKVKNPDILCN